MTYRPLSLMLCTLALAALTPTAFAQDAKDQGSMSSMKDMQDMEGMAPMAGTQGQSEGSAKLHALMMQSMQGPMPRMTGDTDKDFAAMMTMHHQQALKMADVLLQYGHDEKLKALARKMQTDQREEITQMAPYTH